jgi:predicted GNAT family acetyltransferase
MEVVQVADAGSFLERAEALLLADEARHNLMLGIAGTLRDHPGHYPEQRFWLVVADARVAAAALRTPPQNLVVAGCARALEALAAALDDDPPGVVGAVPEVEAFAREWESLRGVRSEPAMAQGIYALEELVEPRRPPGAPRRAIEADRELLRGWLTEFALEAVREEPDPAQQERLLEARFTRRDAAFYIWEDEGPVSLAGYGGTTPNGSRIGPVYTPPEHRGRGYGSAVTAAVTADRLAAGRRFCFLYTDLANPTSNRIYVAMGYRRVCDSLDLRFVAG